jgi:ParB-like chromosome segregation protein Spo0J
MLTTKRYDYVPFDQIHMHPCITNHRPLNEQKVAHYSEDILKNGLLEPLIVWERKPGEYFLVGGFHRLTAIKDIRSRHAGYFDRIDVRVVDGELDEMRALNLKLNADRLDAKPSDYFDAVIYLNNANWEKQKVAQFLDKSVSWIEDIVRYVPGMDPRLRKLLDEGKVSWNKARNICRMALDAEPGREKDVVEKALAELAGSPDPSKAARRPLTVNKVARRLFKQVEKNPKARYSLNAEDLLSLFLVLQGNGYTESHLDRVRKAFPAFVD